MDKALTYENWAYMLGEYQGVLEEAILGRGNKTGIIGDVATCTIPREVAGKITLNDLNNMLCHQWKDEQIDGLLWMMNPSCYNQIEWAVDTLFAKGGKKSTTLLGILVIFSMACSPLGDLGDILLCDFSKLLQGGTPIHQKLIQEDGVLYSPFVELDE